MPGGSAPWSRDSALIAQHDRLNAVAKLQFSQHGGDVCLYGRRGQEQVCCDLGVGASASKLAENLALALSQGLQIGDVLIARAGSHRRLDERLCERRVEQCFAAYSGARGMQEMGARRRLQQKAAYSRPQCFVDVLG